MATAGAGQKDPRLVHDLTHLISTGGSTTIYPNDDAIISLLNARFRHDLPYTRLGATSVVVVNPLKVLQSSNDASAKEYTEKTYNDLSGSAFKTVQPHLFDFASRVYLAMRRRDESQAILLRCVGPVFRLFGGFC